MSVDTEILIIGGGMSGIGLAVQLIRTIGTRNFRLIEKSDNIGGTWWLNSYPGCGCDVPSHFYSYSFALNPDWSRKYATQPEIHAYFASVAHQYNVLPHVRFNSTVERGDWDADSGTWLVTIFDEKTSIKYFRRCKVLVSAVGALSIPKKSDVPGTETFEERLFHSAQWDHTFDWKDKDVVTIGNGCSATQFVPVISAGSNKAKRVTQFSRQAHWLSARPNPAYSQFFIWLMKRLPGAMRTYRAYLYLLKEQEFYAFPIESGAQARRRRTKLATDYIKKHAPTRYHDALVPKTEIGCKRQVMDTDYLASLHRDNVELVADDPIVEILRQGVLTRSARLIKADAIILATGFETQKVLCPPEIRGENGISASQHWNQVSGGVPQAYFGTCIAGFPNFFAMMGPNTVSGHLSVIYTVECQINFTLRLIGPILKSIHPPRAAAFFNYQCPDRVVVKAEAEMADNHWIQTQARRMVWSTGCTSWFVDEKSGKNTQMYPDWQFKFWLRSYFIPWGDFVYGRV